MGLLGRKVRREGASGLPFLAHLVQKHSSTVSIVLSVLPAFPGPICIKYPPHNLVRATRKKSKEREAALAAIVHTGKLFGYIFRGRYPPPPTSKRVCSWWVEMYLLSPFSGCYWCCFTQSLFYYNVSLSYQKPSSSSAPIITFNEETARSTDGHLLCWMQYTIGGSGERGRLW